jgi:hypothetical protein
VAEISPAFSGSRAEKALKLTVNDRLRKVLRGNEERDLLLWEEIAAGNLHLTSLVFVFCCFYVFS